VNVYIRRFVVGPESMDEQGHVSNLAYVGWMQEVAIDHSAAAGWPMGRYRALGAGWVVRSHFVEYLRPAVAGQRLAVYTWVPEFTQRSTPRRFLFVREDDHQLLVRAETRWVFVDLTTGRRRALPDELLAAFAAVPDEGEVRRLAGLDS
jgi:acyl-CoA thioester hydrolase